MSESNLWSYGLAGTNSENFETRSLPTLARCFPRSFSMSLIPSSPFANRRTPMAFL